jgi:hypothetical protein
MADKVLAIIRATLLHENTVESLSFHPNAGEVVLSLLQPNDRYEYHDYELILTFSGIRSFTLDRDGAIGTGEMILSMECVQDQESYRVEIIIGQPSTPGWRVQLVFTGLKYKRFPDDSPNE